MRRELERGLMLPPLYLLIALCFWSFVSLFPGNAGSATIDDATCLDCHEDMNKTLHHTPHRLSSEITSPKVNISCTSCHAGGEVHIEDPSEDNISNPANLDGRDILTVCSQCHVSHRELDNYGFDNHAVLEMNCTKCHDIHGGTRSLLLDDKASFCQKCHIETKTKFHRRSNHPVMQGNLTCLSCHRFTRRQDDNVQYDINRVCQDCHPDEGGPVLYEHDAVNGYSVQGGGCVNCHEPHGSENNYLLKQRGNGLCKNCHVEHVTRHHNQLWDEVWSKIPCQTCHIDTHGSFVSKLLLDPDLPVKFNGDCYQSGCHSLNGQ